MFPKLFEFSESFYIPTYGVLVAIGFLAGLWLAGRLGRRAGLDQEKISNLAIYCTLTGFLGAKLLMFLFDWRLYARDPGRIFSMETLQAAGVFHGGFIVALLFAYFYIQHSGLPLLRTMDVFAPAVALGHSVGRLGCFAAGCCWGRDCDRSWAVTFSNPEAREITGVPIGVPLHPTQLYEAFSGLLITWVLYRLFVRPHREGFVIGLYLVLFSLARFVSDFFRQHQQPHPFGAGLSNVQWIVLGLALFGLVLIARSRSQPLNSLTERSATT